MLVQGSSEGLRFTEDILGDRDGYHRINRDPRKRQQTASWQKLGAPNRAALLNAKQESGEYNGQDKGEMLKVQEGILHGGMGENDLSKLRKSSRWT